MTKIKVNDNRSVAFVSTEVHYLDHAGATQYSDKLLADVFDNLRSNVYGNPHTSKAIEDLVDQVRYKVLEFFNTSTEEYSVIFTSGATASLKLLAESFDFGGDGSFVYLRDNHTSVLGMREIVASRDIVCLEHNQFLQSQCNHLNLSSSGNHLVVFSAQCNFNGFKFPLQLIEQIQQQQSARTERISFA